MLWFEAEQHIKARLVAVVPSGVLVFSAADLAGVEEKSQYTPAVHVLYRQYDVVKRVSPGKARIRQTWWATIAVREETNQITGEKTRAAASQLIGTVVENLDGYKLPIVGSSALELINGGQAVFSAGYMYLPIGFSLELTINGVC